MGGLTRAARPSDAAAGRDAARLVERLFPRPSPRLMVFAAGVEEIEHSHIYRSFVRVPRLVAIATAGVDVVEATAVDAAEGTVLEEDEAVAGTAT